MNGTGFQMTNRQIKEEAVGVVNRAVASGKELILIEYISIVLYREDHPEGPSLGAHNALVRATMRKAVRRKISFRQRIVR
jgi:hypothetical protein